MIETTRRYDLSNYNGRAIEIAISGRRFSNWAASVEPDIAAVEDWPRDAARATASKLPVPTLGR
jgi:hypothetical protein